MSEGTDDPGEPSHIGPPDDVLRLVEAHAGHVATQLPRGQLGTQAAEAFLHAIPGGVRLRLGDVTGTAAYLAQILVAHGLLPVLPNPKVSRAIPRLLAPLTPLVTPRSARTWTLWLTGLQDPRSPLVSKLRKATPPGALVVRTPTLTGRVQTQRELAAERDALAAKFAALQAAHDELASKHAAGTEARDLLAAQLATQAEKHDELAAFHDVLTAQNASLRQDHAQLVARHAEDAAEHDSLAAQLSSLQAERDTLAERLAARTRERDRALAERDTAKKSDATVQQELAELRERLRLAEVARTSAERDAKALTAKMTTLQQDHARNLAEARIATPEREKLTKLHEAQLQEAWKRAAEGERHTRAATQLAELQAFLRETIRGQEQLTLFALRKPK